MGSAGSVQNDPRFGYGGSEGDRGSVRGRRSQSGQAGHRGNDKGASTKSPMEGVDR